MFELEDGAEFREKGCKAYLHGIVPQQVLKAKWGQHMF